VPPAQDFGDGFSGNAAGSSPQQRRPSSAATACAPPCTRRTSAASLRCGPTRSRRTRMRGKRSSAPGSHPCATVWVRC
jgi:hypothetical protein